MPVVALASALQGEPQRAWTVHFAQFFMCTCLQLWHLVLADHSAEANVHCRQPVGLKGQHAANRLQALLQAQHNLMLQSVHHQHVKLHADMKAFGITSG